MPINLVCKAQIAILIANEAPVTILAEYLDFIDIFFKKSAVILSEYTKINTYTMDLEKGKQPSYGLIYSLKPIKLKTLKTYIKTNLANSFIQLFKSLTGTPILFDKKLNRSF